jgi:hypothetical protein
MSPDSSADAAPVQRRLSNTAAGDGRSPARIGTDALTAARKVNEYYVQRIAQQHARIERLDYDAARRHD